jgi:uncharacterized protein YrrD
MTRLHLNLDSDLRGRRVYLAKTRREFGFVDDVIIDPKVGILAVVSHSRFGTWAFPYTHTHIASDGITVAEHGKQSPRSFLREGRSYQEMLGGMVLGPDGSMIGRIKKIELVDLRTGEIAYRVSPPGLSGIWAPHFSVHATDVFAETHGGIVLRGGPEAAGQAAGVPEGDRKAHSGITAQAA